MKAILQTLSSLTRYTLILAALLCGVGVMAQVAYLPVSGHKDTTVSSVTVYDDGGPGVPYNTRANGSWTFHTTNPNNVFRIKYHQDFWKSRGVAWVRIYSGDNLDDNSIIISSDHWYWNRYIYSSGNTITIAFSSDDDNPSDGFEIELCEAGGDACSNLQTQYLSDDSVRLSWDEQGTSTHWVIDYIFNSNGDPESSFSDSNQMVYTVFSDTNFVDIGGVTGMVNFDVHPQSDAPCGKGTMGYYCPCIYTHVNIHYDSDSLRITWNDTADFWELRGWFGPGDSYVDTILRDTVYAIAYQCTNSPDFWWELSGGNCRFDSAYCNHNNGYLAHSQCELVHELGRGGATDSSIVVHWRHYDWVDSCLGFVVQYRDSRYPADSNRVVDTLWWNDMKDSLWGRQLYWWEYYWTDTISGLEPNTNYTVGVKRICLNGSLSCPREITINTTLSDCIDYINIYDLEKVHLTWGYYDDPYLSLNHDTLWQYQEQSWGYNNDRGVWDFWKTDRHQVFTDTNQLDWNTGGVLRCVPQGKKASLRLGNPEPGAEAETITYDVEVDSNNYDLLILKYAIVMQNPDHTPSDQPHFTLELLDSDGVLLDSTCCYADFVAANNMEGWNYVPNSNIMFKDWTTIGLNIAPYHGQTIKVRLTNKDCAEGGHWSYSYFTIHCDNKRICLYNLCDAMDSIHLRVPQGFEYKWTRNDDPTIVGTSYDIVVPTNRADLYKCRCSFLGKPECYFTMESYAVSVIPKASFTYSIDTCRRTAYLVNKSLVWVDSSYEVCVPQVVDTFYWRLEDGSIRSADTLKLTFTENRTYNYWLVSHLSESWCRDSVPLAIDVDFAYDPQIVGDTVYCMNDTVSLTLTVDPPKPYTYWWNTGDTLATMVHVAGSDSLYYVLFNDGHCTDSVARIVHVNPVHSDTLVVSQCSGDVFDSLGFYADVAGLYSHVGTNSFGCDSVFSLQLIQHPSYNDSLYVATCDEPYHDEGFDLDESGYYFRQMATQTYGCDSVVHLFFTRHELFFDTIEAEIAMGDTYTGHGFYESEEGQYSHTFTDVYGCDSTYHLNLTVIGLMFPNLVTPNGDGINDVFEIHDIIRAKMYDYSCIWIYNKYGSLVFKKENINSKADCWDPLATHSPDGAYFYRFNARSLSKFVEHKGVIEVLR